VKNLVKVIDKKERNLLINSVYLRKSKNLREILTLLEKSESVDSKMISSGLKEQIYSNKPLWLDMSRAEWKLRKINPKLTNKSLDKSKWKRCSLCYTKNKHEYYIVNKSTKKELNIGGECVKKFLGDEIGSISKHVLKNPKAAILYEELQNEYPIVQKILFDDKTYLQNSNFVLPTLLKTSFTKIRKKMQKTLNNYLSGKAKNLDKTMFESYLKEYELIKNEIETFIFKSESNNWSCPKKLSKEIERIQSDSSGHIIQSIESNSGLISFSIAPEIRVPIFLNTFMVEFNKIPHKLIKIIDYGIGTIKFEYSEDQLSYVFSVSSSVFISFFSKEVFSIRAINELDFVRDFNVHFEPDDRRTIALLEQTAEVEIERKYDFREFEINYKTLFNKDPKTDYKYEQRMDRLANVTNNITFYQKFGDNKVYVFDRNIFSEFGKKLFFNPLIRDTLLKEFLMKANILTQSNFYSYLKEKVFATKIQNL